tara:strand:+ start:867 stop:1448 length:582 start_codon:yes stop_codon:yes gene_type:complete
MKKLNDRIAKEDQERAKKGGASVAEDVMLLRAMKKRVSVLCDSEEYLSLYRKHIQTGGNGNEETPSSSSSSPSSSSSLSGLPPHHSHNKLRDTDDYYLQNGHTFSYNNEILFSYDVCGGCEAHALMLGYKRNLWIDIDIDIGKEKDGKDAGVDVVVDVDEVEIQRRVDSLPLLESLDKKYTRDNVNFVKCPKV